VNATEDGTLRALNSEWVEVAPLTFDERYGDRTLVFREGEDGEITHFFMAGVPIVAFERVPWRERPVLHLLIIVFASAMILGTVLGWPFGWLVRRWYGVKLDEAEKIPTKARWVLWINAAVFLLFLLGFGVIMAADPDGIAVAVPMSLKIVLLIPFLGAGLTLVSLYCAVVIQQQGFGRRITRFLYSATVLSFVLFLWQLHVWNAIGWRF
jgi:hypothetical protein